MGNPILSNGIELELREDNPFSTADIFTYEDGTMSMDRKPANYEKSPNDRFYDVTGGDQIWNISYLAYTNSKEWWRIADANNIDKPWELTIGSTLLVPDFLTSKLIN